MKLTLPNDSLIALLNMFTTLPLFFWTKHPQLKPIWAVTLVISCIWGFYYPVIYPDTSSQCGMSWGFWTLLIGVTFYLSFLLPKYHVRCSSDHRVRPSQKMNISSWKLSKSQKDMVSQPLGSNDATIYKSICKFNGIILIASMYYIFTAYIYHKHQPKVYTVGKYN